MLSRECMEERNCPFQGQHSQFKKMLRLQVTGCWLKTWTVLGSCLHILLWFFPLLPGLCEDFTETSQ